jgi:hypothetical protein
MQSYRVVPVGDKLVLLIELDQRALSERVADYFPLRDVKPHCYDFGIGRSSQNERLNQVTTSIGGDSHE